MSNSKAIQAKIYLLLSLALVSLVKVSADENRETAAADRDLTRTSNRVNYSNDVDESSCICGINKDILARIEAIVQKASSPSQCSVATNGFSSNSTTSDPASSTLPQEPSIQNREPPTSSQDQSQPDQGGQPDKSQGGFTWPFSSSQTSGSDSFLSHLTNGIQSIQTQLANSRPGSSTIQQVPQLDSANRVPSVPLPSPTTPYPSTPSSPISTNLRPPSEWNLPSSGSSNANGLQAIAPSDSTLGFNWQILSSSGSVPLSLQRPQTGQVVRPIQEQQNPLTGNNFGFLQGGAPNLSNQNQAQEQTNLVQPHEVQSAVESTVPNAVANIFTNIQDLAIQTAKNPNAADPSDTNSQLTSIDGSSANLGINDTAEQITAQGEQLFLQWIEHQIQAYHMTASMAAYIRKNAINLFRRIVRQYVQRIERLGGTVQNNVRQATQMALNNTQNIIAFLLRNYLNVAGGLMRIIGEQVSRVGKQLDSTGSTIAQVNLNPFDIVSNVIDSLPNPSRYSEYFRAFGKYLMGESLQNNSEGQQQQQQQQDQDRPRGLFSKTMGALGKTFGSWMG